MHIIDGIIADLKQTMETMKKARDGIAVDMPEEKDELEHDKSSKKDTQKEDKSK